MPAKTVVYKDIPGFPGYRVGSDGTIWTCRRKGGNDRGADRFTSQWRRLKATLNNGYLRVALVQNGCSRSRAVHCLVLEAFVGPCPPGMEACHYPDSSRANNRLENLRWDTHSENAKDKYRNRPPVVAKECRRCGAAKPLAEFYRDKRSTDGRKVECKTCHIATARATRDPHKKRVANREFMRRRRARRGATPEGTLPVSGG